MKRHIPDQQRQTIFNVIIDGLIEMYNEDYGEYVNAAILSKQLKVSDIIDRAKEKNA